jgi:hypothetical protein
VGRRDLLVLRNADTTDCPSRPNDPECRLDGLIVTDALEDGMGNPRT